MHTVAAIIPQNFNSFGELLRYLHMALTSLGKVLYEQGETEQALATVKEALAIAEGIHDTWGLSKPCFASTGKSRTKDFGCNQFLRTRSR